VFPFGTADYAIVGVFFVVFVVIFAVGSPISISYDVDFHHFRTTISE
jgi:hypothetical protein